MAEQMLKTRDDYLKMEQELVQREAELAIINSIQQGLASRLEVQSIYDLVGDKIRDIFDAQIVMISTYDHQTNSIEHRYAIEQGERVYAPGHFPIRGFRTQIVQTRQPVLVSKEVAEQAARLGQPTLPGTITPKTWLGVPMVVGNQVTGILSLQNIELENAFDESDVRLLQTLAASMSVALENARLFDETQRLLKETEHRAKELQIINSIQEGLAQKLEVVSIYRLVGKKIHSVFLKADLALGSYDTATGDFSVHFQAKKSKRPGFESCKVNGRELLEYFRHMHQPLLINETVKQAQVQVQGLYSMRKEIPKSAMYVPLELDGSIRGAILLEDMVMENAFNDSDQRLLETLSNSMSVALENARLWEQEEKSLNALEHEFEVGREIQAGFLPDILPQPKGWEIAASLQPAREVAGDFYDVFQLPDENIGLVIADVCDKGLGAALFMTLIRSFIRAVSNIDFYARVESKDGSSSAERLKNAISLTNNYIAETHGDTGMFATIFFGIFDIRTGVLTYINGGHLPPLLINKQGVKELLNLTGTAVGAAPDTEYAIKEVVIEPGDTFFDGISDTTNPAGEYFNETGLIPILAKEQPLTSTLSEIQGIVDGFSANAARSDDITILAVRRLIN
jgi:serine phosphatase RsbU (regulator of sigma subunit)